MMMVALYLRRRRVREMLSNPQPQPNRFVPQESQNIENDETTQEESYSTAYPVRRAGQRAYSEPRNRNYDKQRDYVNKRETPAVEAVPHRPVRKRKTKNRKACEKRGNGEHVAPAPVDKPEKTASDDEKSQHED